MNVDESALIEAIKNYAALYDRPYWADPDRLTMQTTLWRRLVERKVDLDGLVTIEDFIDAEDWLLRPPKPDGDGIALRDISPKHIIDIACERAYMRRQRAAKAVKFPTMVLYAERADWRESRLSTDEDADPGESAEERRQRADVNFMRSIGALIYDLRYSGLPRSVTTPIIEDLRERMAGSGLVPAEPAVLDLGG